MQPNFAEQIKYLAENTKLSNAQIAKKLGCAKRTVRRHAGPYEERLKKFFGITPDELKANGAKILLFDLETAPLELYGWGLKTNGWISPKMIKKDWSILCWCAKWLFDHNVMAGTVTPKEAYNRRDRSVVDELWTLLDEADIVIAHNGARFDVRRMNARFKVNGLGPPMPYKVIDTLRVLRQQFDLAAYNMDYVNRLFGLDTKKGNEEGMLLWKKCVGEFGPELALAGLGDMTAYCENDVLILEELYVDIRPWIKGHPNMGLYQTGDGVEKCYNCGSSNLDWRGKYFTPAGRYRAYRCECGAVGRSRTADLSKEEKEEMTRHVT